MRPVGIVIGCVLAAALLPKLRGDDRKGPPPELPPPATGKMDFAKDIEPILKRSCLRCHFSPQPRNSNRRSDRGGFSLSTRGRALQGGGTIGVVIIPNHSAESKLIWLVAGFPDDKLQVPAMPPREQDRLSKDEIGKLRAWIDQGAKWPE